MGRVKILLSIAGLLFLTAAVLTIGLFIKGPKNISEKAAAGTSLSLLPAIHDASPGSDIAFSVLMNTADNNVTGVDLLINFDPNVIQISSLKRGSGSGPLNNTISNNFDNASGTISYAIFTLDKTQALKGSDIEILQIKAKVVANAPAGSHTLTFDQSTAISATGENQNSLVLAVPGTVKITDSATPVPTPSPVVTGEPNSCGGTCGSNANCGSNLYCYQGYCRNPSCSWSSNCSCSSPTPAPTAVPTRQPTVRPGTGSNSTPVPTPEATEEPVLIEYTPEPTTSNEKGFWEGIFNSGSTDNTPTQTIEPSEIKESKAPNFLPWIIGSLIVAGVTLIFIVLGILKEMNRSKNKPPVIKV